MSTLGDMKTRILQTTNRDDLADAVAQEISSAIKFYRAKRFWFNEKHDEVMFDTVDGRGRYDVTDNPNIPNLFRIDYMTVEFNGRVLPIRLEHPEVIDVLLGSSAIVYNPPVYYSYYDQVLRFFPIPNAAYPIRVVAVIRIPEPATDEEEDNPWMTDGEELIRSRATRFLYDSWMEDPAMADRWERKEREVYAQLRRETSSRTQVTRIRSDTQAWRR